MEKPPTIINMRLRKAEAAQLQLMRAEFRKNLKARGIKSPEGKTQIAYFLRMSRHRILHAGVDYLFHHRKQFLSLLLDMAEKELIDMDDYEAVYGRIQDLELSKQQNDANYIDLLAGPEPLTRENYEKIITAELEESE